MCSLLRGTPGRVMSRLAPLAVAFARYPRTEVETSTVIVSTYATDPIGELVGNVVAATPEERDRYSQDQAIVRSVLVVRGTPSPAVSPDERLVRVTDGRAYYVADAVDEGGLGLATRIVLEERPDATP